MKKTRHQIFVDELHKQLTNATSQRSDSPERQGTSEDDEGLSQSDIMRDIERKFDELFGDLVDDSGN